MKQERSFIVDVLFVLALFGVFAISALVLVTIGADVYQHTVQDMTDNYETRTAISYVTEKIRQNDITAEDCTGSVNITTLAGEPALMLTQHVDEQAYCTYLYLYNGYLKELFMQQDSSLGGNALEAGTNIMELDSLHLEQISPRLLSIEMSTKQGELHRIYVSTHCDDK